MLNNILLQFWNAWKAIPSFIKENIPWDEMKSTIRKEGSKINTQWTNYITQFILKIFDKFSYLVKLEEKIGRRKKDFTIYNDKNERIIHIEHENQGVDIYGEIQKLHESPSPNKILISYFTYSELKYHINYFLKQGIQKIIDENPHQQWLLIFGTGKVKKWLPNTPDEWVAFLFYKKKDKFCFEELNLKS